MELSLYNDLFDMVCLEQLPEFMSTVEKFPEFDVTALCDATGKSLLDVAVVLDKVKFVRYFLEMGTDINAFTMEQPPIQHTKSVAMLELLLSFGAAVNYTPKDTVTLLFTKANHGKSDQVKFLLDHGADMFPYGAVDHDKALLYACAQKGTLDIIRCLVERGADVNAIDEDGVSPLLGAIASDLPFDIIQFLMDHGADVHHTANCGKNALMFAFVAKHKAAIAYFLEIDYPVNAITTFDRKTALHYAVGCGACAEVAVRSLITRGANVNAVSKDGGSALHRAAYNGYTALLAILLENGAIVNLANATGTTSLMYAVEMAHLNSIQLLLDHGANPALVDYYGRSAYDMALAKNVDVFHFLTNPRKRRRTVNANRS